MQTELAANHIPSERCRHQGSMAQGAAAAVPRGKDSEPGPTGQQAGQHRPSCRRSCSLPLLSRGQQRPKAPRTMLPHRPAPAPGTAVSLGCPDYVKTLIQHSPFLLALHFRHAVSVLPVMGVSPSLAALCRRGPVPAQHLSMGSSRAALGPCTAPPLSPSHVGQ